jgi:hypothetical protein
MDDCLANQKKKKNRFFNQSHLHFLEVASHRCQLSKINVDKQGRNFKQTQSTEIFHRNSFPEIYFSLFSFFEIEIRVK